MLCFAAGTTLLSNLCLQLLPQLLGAALCLAHALAVLSDPLQDSRAPLPDSASDKERLEAAHEARLAPGI